MEFTENFKNAQGFRKEGQYLIITGQYGKELKLFVGEEIDNAKWTDEGRLVVTLQSGAVRVYENETNYINI